MPAKQELERRDLTELAVLCQKVAENSSVDSVTAERARTMKEEWASLIARETPPPPSFKDQQETEVPKQSLKKRMADFLAGTL